jgi:hypothetical protein
VSTIENCFKKCGFGKNSVEDECEVDHEFIEYWDTASRILDINIDFNEFVECNDKVAVCETITNDNIVDGIIEKRNDGEQSVSYETEANDEEIVCEIVTEVDPKLPSLLDELKRYLHYIIFLAIVMLKTKVFLMICRILVTKLLNTI